MDRVQMLGVRHGEAGSRLSPRSSNSRVAPRRDSDTPREIVRFASKQYRCIRSSGSGSLNIVQFLAKHEPEHNYDGNIAVELSHVLIGREWNYSHHLCQSACSLGAI